MANGGRERISTLIRVGRDPGVSLTNSFPQGEGPRGLHKKLQELLLGTVRQESYIFYSYGKEL